MCCVLSFGVYDVLSVACCLKIVVGRVFVLSVVLSVVGFRAGRVLFVLC